MTTVAYALGRPRPAVSRGGDCRAHDLDQDEDVFDERYRFAATTHCRIANGMLRLTVGASGAAPSLTVEAWRGRVVMGDVYEDTYTDTYGGSYSTPEWIAMGTVTIDSPSVAVLLTAVRPVRLDAEGVTIRLVAPLMRDAFVALRRGERMCRIQHGSSRPPFVDTDRRIRWTAAPSPVGTAAAGRVEEVTAAAGLDGMSRLVASIDPVTTNAGDFSVTAASVTTARFGAGVGGHATHDHPLDYHRQLGGDVIWSEIVIGEDVAS